LSTQPASGAGIRCHLPRQFQERLRRRLTCAVHNGRPSSQHHACSIPQPGGLLRVGHAGHNRGTRRRLSGGIMRRASLAPARASAARRPCFHSGARHRACPSAIGGRGSGAPATIAGPQPVAATCRAMAVSRFPLHILSCGAVRRLPKPPGRWRLNRVQFGNHRPAPSTTSLRQSLAPAAGSRDTGLKLDVV
jgi:hypothetical protein